MGETCLTSTEFALDKRRLSSVLYVYTTTWKQKQCCISLAVLSQGLFNLTCSHFTNAVCHLCLSAWSLLFTIETGETKMFKHTIVLLPLGRSCVSTRCHRLAKLKTFWHNYNITSPFNSCMCAVSLPSHLNSKLKQTAYSVKPTPESIEHPVRLSTAWQSVRQPYQMPSGRESYSLPSGMILRS